MIWPLLFLFLNAFAYDCHYDYTVWNTLLKRSEGPIPVRKFRKNLSKNEMGPLGCTICSEDQRRVRLSNGIVFESCFKVAPRFKQLLEKALERGVQLEKVLGYRASKSKGKMDGRGFRTEFSGHAFGIALDVNENQNGLYSHCLQWGATCILMKGGPYRPNQDPRSLTPDSDVVRLMKEQGFKWGGLIQGGQKDFMHFSPDGY